MSKNTVSPQKPMSLFWLLTVLTVASLHAQSWSLQLDNDFVFGTDGEYTGGIQIGWMSSEYNATRPGSFERGYDDLLTGVYPFDLSGMKRSGAIDIHGVAITPMDTQSKTPVYNDVPYMGMTSATFSLFIWNARYFHQLLFSAGATGPASGAGWTQKAFHRLIGNSEPQGWGNQLGNRLLLQAGYHGGTRQYTHRFSAHHTLEWFGNYYADAGTLFVCAGAGTVVRFGRNVPRNFKEVSGFLNSTIVRQLALESRKGRWGWDVDAGAGVNAIGWFYLYEASKGLGYEYDRPSALMTVYFGVNVYYENIQVALEAYPSRPLDRGLHTDSFGRLSMTWWLP